MIRVLVVDDSATVRAYVKSLLEEDRDLQVIGEAADGEEAVSACAALRPDVMTMDLIMPGGGGVQAIRRIMAETPTPIVIVSALAEYEKDLTVFEGLAAGALAVVRRPPSHRHPEFADRQRELLEAVKMAAGIVLVRRRAPRAPHPGGAAAAPTNVQLVGIGASTGGPAALLELLKSLPKDFAPSIAIVQHIAPGFVTGLVEWLNGSSPVPVRLAAPGLRLPWRGAVVAPDHAHLIIRHDTLYTEATPPRNGHRPSVDALFESMADWRPRACAGILLTGMGEDGVHGLGRLLRLGARTMVQAEEGCVVFGMPGAALKAGAAETALSPAGLGRALLNLAPVA